jgi:hypothetical protein
MSINKGVRIMTTAQQELYDIIARIEPDDALFILNFIKRFVLEDDVVSGDDLEAIKTAREQFHKGEYSAGGLR